MKNAFLLLCLVGVMLTNAATYTNDPVKVITFDKDKIADLKGVILTNVGGFFGSASGATNLTWSRFINVRDHGAIGDGTTDDTAAVQSAINACSSNSVVIFPCGKYVIGSLNTITNPVSLDFCNSMILPNTTNVMFLYQLNGDHFANSIVIKDGTVITGPQNPSSIVRFLYGGINPTIRNLNAQNVTFTHSFIYNYASYGLHLVDCKVRNSTMPQVFFGAHSDTIPTILSLAISVDHCDFSNVSGIGVYIQGGIITIGNQTVLEGCVGGGFVHGDVAYAQKVVLDGVYFEQNYAASVVLSSMGGNYTIQNCFFGDGTLPTSSPNHVIMKGSSDVTAIANTFTEGGVAGYAPKSYIGINNIIRRGVTNYTGTFDKEISDDIRGSIQCKIINTVDAFKNANVASGTSSNIVSAQPLKGTAVDEWRIVSSFNLVAGPFEIFKVYVSQEDFGIIGRVVTELQEDEILTLDKAPNEADFFAGNTLTGSSSGATCKVVEQKTSYIYKIKERVGEFVLGSTISNGTDSATQGVSFPTVTTASGVPHSLVTVTDLTNKYNITVKNTGTIPMDYYLTYIGNSRRY